MSLKEWAILGGAVAIALVAAAVVLPLVPAWWRARRAGVKVMFGEVVGMRLRKSPVGKVLRAAEEARRGGVAVTVSQLETHSLAGGDVLECVQAMVEAKQRGLKTDWKWIVACSLAGRDVVAIVREGVEPGRVIGAKTFEGRFEKRRT